MNALTLISRRCIPKENDLSYSPTIFGEKHEMALLGLIDTCLNDQIAYDFSKHLLRNRLTHISPETKGYHVRNTTPLPAMSLSQNSKIAQHGTT